MDARQLTPADIEAAKVLSDAVESCGLTHEAIAAEVGVSVGMIHQWTKPLRPVSLLRAPALARAVGIANPSVISPAFAEFMRAAGGTADQVDTLWTDITSYAQAAAAGDGASPDEYAETDRLKFKSSSLRKKGLHARKLAVFYADGDSMEGRIHNGDALLFDQDDTTPRDGKIFVVKYKGDYLVKRLEQYGQQWFLKSDNTDDPKWKKPVPVTIGDTCEIIGRVRWIGSWED